ncbi:MAG TPA: formate dehydrogenase subunit gamma, partial [Alphaproteobacteria bacterium]|nr:formate dehydrogenase subunit gamma [Alphaproteobacteria bacterium]
VDPEILRDRGYIRGTVNLPEKRAEVLQQPGGRDWRRVHNDQITYGGGWVIFGFSLLLALFLLVRGRVPLHKGFSGREVKRFNALERANHWVTATSFLVLAVTGLILVYGQYFLKPWMGADAYSGLATGSAWVHMAFMVPFVLGVLLMIALWVHQNIITGRDLKWLAKGGGFVTDKVKDVPPQGRFNAGQKLIFWAVVLSMFVLLGTGLSLMFPFFWLGYDGMQWAQLAHAAVGLVMVAVIIGHIYIGTIGMVGAFWAMWNGRVDRNWAEEHHELWLRRLEGEDRTGQPAPAE